MYLTKYIVCILAHCLMAVLLIHAQALASQVQYAPYTNEAYNFSVQLPSHWEQEASGNAMVFSGPQDTEEWNTTINFQIIPLADSITIDSVSGQLQSQWQGSPNYKLLSETPGKLDGHPALRLLVTYGIEGQNVTISQEQLLVRGNSSIYAIAYTAPESLFERHHDKMAVALDSFRILPAGSIHKATPTRSHAETESDLLLFIEAVQEFRRLNGEDGLNGWHQYADKAVQDYITGMNSIIWPTEQADAGWAYFFSLSMTSIGQVILCKTGTGS